MCNRRLFLGAIILLFTMHSANAQMTSLSKEEAKSLKEKVVKKSKSMTSLSSSFIQYKHLDFLSNDMESSGKLLFKSPDLIKWAYNTPFKYGVIFKGDKLYINDDGKKSDIDLSADKTFKSFNGLIVKSIKGDMFDDSEFGIKYFKKGKNYVVLFSPKKEAIKSLISQFEITFDGKSLDVLQIKMIESSEDYTLLKFTDQVINKAISDAEFSH